MTEHPNPVDLQHNADSGQCCCRCNYQVVTPAENRAYQVVTPSKDMLDDAIVEVLTDAECPLSHRQVAKILRRRFRGVESWTLAQSICRLHASGRIDASKFRELTIMSIPIRLPQRP